MNRLANERSPYLRHAAGQQIDWYSWSEEAFQRAKELDRPIFLSSGAVWCHWCHVMAEESFENEEIARILNEKFISIKLDRDERPDLDRRYQSAVSVMGSGGGWPLSVFLSPGGIPFYGGTYFPPEDRQGVPGFKKVLLKVATFYRANKSRVAEHAEKLVRAISSEHVPTGALERDRVDEAVRNILAGYDSENGGFGSAPKFPMTGAIDLLISRYFFKPHDHLEEVIRKTLEAMAKGGCYDQLGGGFHRYSVDAAWIVPHFEKMASDNAGLLRNYLHAYSVLRTPLFKETAEGIMYFLDTTLSDPEGGFYASQDADVTPSDEGGYFTWTDEDLRESLTSKEYDIIAMHLRGDKGMMHHDSSKFVLYVAEEQERIASEARLSLEEVQRIIREAKKKLLDARNRRREPYIDKTLYTSLNGMLISSYFKAFWITGSKHTRDFSLKSIRKILSLYYNNGRLQHTDGVGGMLEDYMFLIDSLIHAYEATGDGYYIEIAEDLLDTSLRDFWDHGAGGFFDTDEDLLGVRLKAIEDVPSPSSNAVGIMVLLKMHEITSKGTYRKYAEESLRLFAETARTLQIHAASYFLAMDAFFNMLSLTVEDSPASRLAAIALSSFRPHKTIRYGEKIEGIVIPCAAGTCFPTMREEKALERFLQRADLPGSEE